MLHSENGTAHKIHLDIKNGGSMITNMAKIMTSIHNLRYIYKNFYLSLQYKSQIPTNFSGVCTINKNTSYYLNGNLHNTHGPAIQYANGNTTWYLNNQLHRTDGPAIENEHGVNPGSKITNRTALMVPLSYLGTKY